MPATATVLAPFERLVKLIELELELAGAGRLDELAIAVVRRGEFLLSLPNPAPPEAEPFLLRARALHSRLSIETQRLADTFDGRRQARRRARTMARTYVPAVPGATYTTSA